MGYYKRLEVKEQDRLECQARTFLPWTREDEQEFLLSNPSSEEEEEYVSLLQERLSDTCDADDAVLNDLAFRSQD